MFTHDRRSYIARGGCCFAFLAAFSLTPAYAFSTPFRLSQVATVTVPLPGGGWRLVPGAPGSSPAATRAWVGRMSDIASAGIQATERVTIAGRAGPLPVQAGYRILLADAAAVVARCLGNPVCVAASGAALYAGSLFYDSYRCKASGGTPTTGVLGVVCDPGAAPVLAGLYCSSSAANALCADSAVGAYRAYADVAARVYVGYSSVEVLGTPSCDFNNYCSGLFVRVGVRLNTGSFNYTDVPLTLNVSVVNKEQCPSGSSMGFDGRCDTGNFVPVTEKELEEKVIAAPPLPGSSLEQNLLDATRTAVENGNLEVPSQLTSSGPASQTGTPVNTTTTDATGTTTDTRTQTFDYTYAGDTVSYTTNETVQTCVGSGSCSTTTVTAPAATPQDPKDPCTASPDRVGCAELGALPTDKVPTAIRDVTFTAEALGLPSGCPADVSLPHGQKISYVTLCDGLEQTRPLIIAFGFLMAGGIVVAALRR